LVSPARPIRIPFRTFILLLTLGAGPHLHAAYVDPGTTSLLSQVLAPVFIVLSLLGGVFRRALGRWFRGLGRRGGPGP